jgi:hypothetical protein
LQLELLIIYQQMDVPIVFLIICNDTHFTRGFVVISCVSEATALATSATVSHPSCDTKARHFYSKHHMSTYRNNNMGMGNQEHFQINRSSSNFRNFAGFKYKQKTRMFVSGVQFVENVYVSPVFRRSICKDMQEAVCWE